MERSTAIHYALPTASKVTIEVFDIRGRIVNTLLDAYREAGYHTVSWKGQDSRGNQVSSGVYFYRAQLGNELTVMKKMVKLE
jgi:flagellar hook assembly protein FlgD